MENKTKLNFMLFISKESPVPMLFLEWIANFSDKDLQFKVYDDKDDNQFRVYLNNSTEETYKSLQRYIELNS